MTVTPLQCRMARAALNLSVRDLARQAGIPATTLSRFENGQPASPERLSRLRFVLEETGIILLPEDAADGPGIRLAKGFRRGFVYDREGKQVANIIGHVVVDVAREQRVATAQGDELFTLGGEALGTLGTVDVFQQTGSLPDQGLRLLAEAGTPAPLLVASTGSLDLLLDPEPSPP